MNARKRTAFLAAGLVVLMVSVTAYLVGAYEDSDASISAGQSQAVEHTPLLDARSEAQLEESTSRLADPIAFSGEAADDVVYVAKEDYVRAIRTDLAKQRGAAWSNGDELATARDTNGNVVGYVAPGTGFITLKQAEEPGFELCKLQDERSSIADIDINGKVVPRSHCA